MYLSLKYSNLTVPKYLFDDFPFWVFFFFIIFINLALKNGVRALSAASHASLFPKVIQIHNEKKNFAIIGNLYFM